MNINEILIASNAISINTKEPYTYSSGILSPIYTDNRILISEPRYFTEIVKKFIKAIKDNKIQFDKLAGTSTAGIPWAAFLAYKLKVPMVYVRNEAKDHGKKNLIEGKLNGNEKVLVVEDLISTGGSSIRTIKAIKNAGAIVEACTAIFTYNMAESKSKFEEEGVKLITLTNIDNLLKFMIKKSMIKKEDKKTILDWKENQESWGQKYGFK